MNGIDEFYTFGGFSAVGIGGVVSFFKGPSVVDSFFDNVDFLMGVLSDVGGPEFFCCWVERKTPRVAQAEGENFRMIARFFKEGVL